MTDAMLSLFPRSFGNRFALPMTIITAMVSPIARPTASTMDINIFGIAAGRIMVAAAYQSETPSAAESSRYFFLSFNIVSQQEDTRYGRSITASRIPAASTQEPV